MVLEELLEQITEDVVNINNRNHPYKQQIINYSTFSKKELYRRIENINERIEKLNLIKDEMKDALKKKKGAL